MVDYIQQNTSELVSLREKKKNIKIYIKDLKNQKRQLTQFESGKVLLKEPVYLNNKKNYAVGFELFDVVKRDYKMRFGTQSYGNLVGSVNFYHRNYKGIPFDTKISYGEYLAGDEGITLDFSRTFFLISLQ